MLETKDIQGKVDFCKHALLAYNGRPTEIKGYPSCDINLNKILIDLSSKGYYPGILARASGLTVAEVLRAVPVRRPEGVNIEDFYGEGLLCDDIEYSDITIIYRKITDTSDGSIVDYVLENQDTLDNYILKAEFKEDEDYITLTNLRIFENFEDTFSISNVITDGDLNILSLLRLSEGILPIVSVLYLNNFQGSSNILYSFLLSKYAKAIGQGNASAKEDLESLQIIREFLEQEDAFDCEDEPGIGIWYEDFELEDIE